MIVGCGAKTTHLWEGHTFYCDQPRDHEGDHKATLHDRLTVSWNYDDREKHPGRVGPKRKETPSGGAK